MLSPATESETDLHAPGAWYIPLPGFEFTLCEGADSVRFLQGQLSCNVQKLSPSLSLRGALCNLKGRVITDLRLMPDEKGVLLMTQHGMRQKLITTLEKYRVFFKTTLVPLADRLTVSGMGGPDLISVTDTLGIVLPTQPDQIVEHAGLRFICLPKPEFNKFPRFLCVAPTENTEAQDILRQITGALAMLPEIDWRLADIRDGQVHLRPEQTELFTPQLLNYDINGVIDFKKGCYTGQEIVARMHYRAEAKRRLYHSKSASAPEIADDVVDQLVLADGSSESLIVLEVSVAQGLPGITDFSNQQV